MSNESESTQSKSASPPGAGSHAPQSGAKSVRVHCNACGQETSHHLVARRNHSETEPYDGDCCVWTETTYDMLECAGCQEIKIRRIFVFSEWNPGEMEITFYPPLISRRLPKWCADLPEGFSGLMTEVYTALQAGSCRLAAMGARTLIDLVMEKQVGDIGGFEQKLDELEKIGLLSKVNRQMLEAALDAGNAAAHRGFCPNDKDLNTVMDIVENLLQSTLLKDASSKLRERTPKRYAI